MDIREIISFLGGLAKYFFMAPFVIFIMIVVFLFVELAFSANIFIGLIAVMCLICVTCYLLDEFLM